MISLAVLASPLAAGAGKNPTLRRDQDHILKNDVAGDDIIRDLLGGRGIGERRLDTTLAVSETGGGGGVGGAPASLDVVRIYRYDGENWIQLGQSIEGENARDFAVIMSLSRDGETVAIGAPSSGNHGQVRVFSYNDDSQLWGQVGISIDGQEGTFNSANRFGTAVSLSSEGTTLAASGDGYVTATNGDGYVLIYNLDDGEWSPTGATIEVAPSVGKPLVREFGQSLDLSEDGQTIAIGAPGTVSEGRRYAKSWQYSRLHAMKYNKSMISRSARRSFGRTRVSTGALMVGILPRES